MMQNIIDCQGFACPRPVLECRNFIDAEHPDSLTVIIDNEAARENVTRYLSSQGYTTEPAERDNGRITVRAFLEASSPPEAVQDGTECEVCRVMSAEELQKVQEKVVVFLTTDTIGRGDDVLGSKLMGNFLATLPEFGPELWRIVLLNGAVRLAVNGSSVLETLQGLERDGAEILVCGTCLDHFDLLEQKVVGQTTNMLDVVTSLQLATKVVRP